MTISHWTKWVLEGLPRCMYVCVCMYIHVSIYLFIYVCVSLHMGYVCVYLYVCVYACEKDIYSKRQRQRREKGNSQKLCKCLMVNISVRCHQWNFCFQHTYFYFEYFVFNIHYISNEVTSMKGRHSRLWF